MAQRIVEGQWEELVKRRDLAGRRVKVIVETSDPIQEEPWQQMLRQWVRPESLPGRFVEDRRMQGLS